MRKYPNCLNIRIDGDEYTEGFLGLDWFPSAASEQKKTHFEQEVARILDTLGKAWVGWAVLTEIYNLPKRIMTIMPYYPTAKTGVCNATAGAKNLAAATLKGTTALDNQGRLPAPGQPRTIGTGEGSDTVIRYHPDTFAPPSPCVSGPGATADEILLHEMTHGLRQMMGRSVRESINGNPGMDNYEEFVAILVSNIYRSERGTAQLRMDHHGFAPLTGPTATPSGFETTYHGYLANFDIEQPRLFGNLRKANASFNPVALF